MCSLAAAMRLMARSPQPLFQLSGGPASRREEGRRIGRQGK